ncbi:MAG: hypothetical protein H0W84_05055, partial [Bacteroidetes bacterium]|nr:hypothetical protein [Bacteroidota bacterium]
MFCALIVPTIIFSANIYSRKTGNWTDNSATGTWSTASLGGAACSCVPSSTDNVIIGGSNTITYDVASATTINALQVNVSSKLTITASRILTINTSVTLNGTIDGAGTKNIEYA